MTNSVFRKKQYTKPPKVFICVPAGEYVKLWIRNCPRTWCKRVCQGLQELGLAKIVTWEKKNDIVQRDGHYKIYIEVRLVDTQTDCFENNLLKVAVQSQFRMIQGCEVEWVDVHHFLNMKVWHRT